LVYFSGFGTLHQEKSGKPGSAMFQDTQWRSPSHDLYTAKQIGLGFSKESIFSTLENTLDYVLQRQSFNCRCINRRIGTTEAWI
jgi:hypothetical protein